MRHPSGAGYRLAVLALAAILGPSCGGSGGGTSGGGGGNSNAPSVTITTPGAPQSGNVTISYMLIDGESDTSTIVVKFSLNGGASFNPATAGPGGDGASSLGSSVSPGTAHTFVWNSLADVGAANNATIQIEITPSNADAGVPVKTTNFTVNNATNTAPTAGITTPGASSGVITINYTLTDTQSDPCSIAVQFSTDGGGTFNTATGGPGGEGTTSLTSSGGGTAHTFSWNSVADGVAPAGANANVQVKITPSDGVVGTAATTTNFTVDNTGKTSGSSTAGGFPVTPGTGTAAFEVATDGTNLYIFGYEGLGGGNVQWRVEKRLCSTGALVGGFGTGGVLTTDPGPADDSGSVHIVYDEGFLYLMSGRETGIFTDHYTCYLEKRLASTGALVPAFNGTGQLNGTNMGLGGACGFAVDGSAIYITIIVNPNSGDGGSRIEKRDKITGVLVDGFGTNGVVTSNPTSSADGFLSITLDSTAMYLAGTQGFGSAAGAKLAVEKRLLSDGSRVTAFGTNGTMTESIASNNAFASRIVHDGTSLYMHLLVQPVAGGNSSWRFEKRSMTDGSLTTAVNSAVSDPGTNEGAAGLPYQMILSSNALFAFGCTDLGGGNTQWYVEKRSTASLNLVAGFGTAGIYTNNVSAGNDAAVGAVATGGMLFLVGFDETVVGTPHWRIEARWE